MSKASRRRHILDAVTDIRSAAAGLATAEQVWEDHAPGIRGASYEGRTGPARFDAIDEEFGRAAISDPTGDAAIRHTKAKAEEKRLDRIAKTLANQARDLAATVASATAAAPATVEELAELERQAEPGCEIVARITRPDDGPNYWEPEHTLSDYGGLLQRKYRLGAWADSIVRRHGRLPTEHEATVHCREGKRVRIKEEATR